MRLRPEPKGQADVGNEGRPEGLLTIPGRGSGTAGSRHLAPSRKSYGPGIRYAVATRQLRGSTDILRRYCETAADRRSCESTIDSSPRDADSAAPQDRRAKEPCECIEALTVIAGKGRDSRSTNASLEAKQPPQIRWRRQPPTDLHDKLHDAS